MADAKIVQPDQARRLALVMCEELDTDTSVDAAGAGMLLALSENYPSATGEDLAADTGLVVGAGVPAFCPKHSADAATYSENLGPLTFAVIRDIASR